MGGAATVLRLFYHRRNDLKVPLLWACFVECKRYQGLEILPIPIFCRFDIADNRQTSDHRPIEQYLPIGQCICRYAHYLLIVNAFADTYADIYRQIFFSYRQIFLSIGRYRVYLPIQGLSADNR